MARPKALELDEYYHIYHRGNNREPIFFEEKNYHYFLKQYIKYIEPVAFTHAYSLLNNHFHSCVRTKTEEEQREYFEATKSETSKVFKLLSPSQRFSNFFNSYTKSINKAYGRTGSLFENKFGRKPVTSDSYYYNLIIYIHRNPQRHRLVGDFRDWPWSSYGTILSEKPTRIDRAAVLESFNGRKEFSAIHQHDANEKLIAHLIEDDY